MNQNGCVMKKIYTFIALLLISTQSFSDIETFNDKELKDYMKSGQSQKAKDSFKELNLPFSLMEYTILYIDKSINEKEMIRNMSSEKLSSYCYDASKLANSRLSDCLKGNITDYSKNFIIYHHSLSNK